MQGTGDLSEMASIQDSSDLFVERTMFCKYFLMQMEIKIKNEMNINNVPKHKLCTLKDNDSVYLDHLYHNFDQFNLHLSQNGNEKELSNLLHLIVNTMISLLHNKFLFEALFIALYYIKHIICEMNQSTFYCIR